jgi:hypothetical protein
LATFIMSERYTVILEPLPEQPGRPPPPPPEIRLRQALKLLLRGFRLRAVDVQGASTKPGESASLRTAADQRRQH